MLSQKKYCLKSETLSYKKNIRCVSFFDIALNCGLQKKLIVLPLSLLETVIIIIKYDVVVRRLLEHLCMLVPIDDIKLVMLS